MGKSEMFKRQEKGAWKFLVLGFLMVFMVSAIQDDTVMAKDAVPSMSKTMTINKGETKNLSVTAKSKDITLKKVTWKSSSKKVATVKANGKSKGKVTAVKKGTATITATVSYQYKKKTLKKKFTCKVTVKEIAKPKNSTVPKVTDTVAPTQPSAPNGTPDVTEAPVPSRTPDATKPPVPTRTPDSMETISPREEAILIMYEDEDGKMVEGVENKAEAVYAVISEDVTIIYNAAFSGCSSLRSITIPESVTSIRSWAFWKCSSLTSITIPKNVTNIEDWTFSECSSLTSITIPNSVTSIGECAFEGCSSLTSITIPDSVTSIGSGVFDGCSNLTNIVWKGTTYNSVDEFESAI